MLATLGHSELVVMKEEDKMDIGCWSSTIHFLEVSRLAISHLVGIIVSESVIFTFFFGRRRLFLVGRR